MAIGTLASCYNDPQVFTGVVKIRKGQAVEMIMGYTVLNRYWHSTLYRYVPVINMFSAVCMHRSMYVHTCTPGMYSRLRMNAGMALVE